MFGVLGVEGILKLPRETPWCRVGALMRANISSGYFGGTVRTAGFPAPSATSVLSVGDLQEEGAPHESR